MDAFRHSWKIIRGFNRNRWFPRTLSKKLVLFWLPFSENTYQQDVEIDGQRISLEILDTTLEMQQVNAVYTDHVDMGVGLTQHEVTS